MRRKKKNSGKVVKTLPLSVAIAAISSGMIFASAVDKTDTFDVIRVETEQGKYATFDVEELKNNSEYKTQVQNALKAAFVNNQRSIVIEYEVDGGTGTQKIEFGRKAGDANLDAMLANPENYAPDESYYPY